MKVSSLPPNSFLSDVRVFQADADGQLSEAIGSEIERIALRAFDTGAVVVADSSEQFASIAIPVLRESRVICVAVLTSKSHENDPTLSGVFEAWAPVGVYDELALQAGFFGSMERFRNVSSFVRFEKGSGLPGQVWDRKQSVIHRDLPSHPGFLRAAGASADSLSTAIGIPVASTAYHGTAVLISSLKSPIARAMEVWNVEENRYSLVDSSCLGFDESLSLVPGVIVEGDASLMAMVAEAGTTVLCDDVQRIFVGRDTDAKLPESASGLAIPFYDGERMTSITTLIF